MVTTSSIWNTQKNITNTFRWDKTGETATSSTEAREEELGFETGVIGTGKGYEVGQAVTLTERKKVNRSSHLSNKQEIRKHES